MRLRLLHFVTLADLETFDSCSGSYIISLIINDIVCAVQMLLISFLFLCLASIALSREPECDGTERPRTPTLRDSQEFLLSLYKRAIAETPGAYRWYGRRLEPCPECVSLPAIIYSGRRRCAALIDVDDEHEDDVSIFGLIDLWEALGEVVSVCWLSKRQDGRGYPSGQSAFARLIKSPQEVAISKRIENAIGNRTVNMIDLDELAIRAESLSEI